MADPVHQLIDRFQAAIVRALGEAHAGADPVIRPSGRPEFGDYQANAAMSLGKRLNAKPREVAQRLVEAAELDDLCERVEIAGPGFINLTLRRDRVEGELRGLAEDPRLGVTEDAQPDTVVVDYGGPNVAKEMHVGHLRSTIIGDAIARLLAFLGHRVIRQNHIGDWGTQFGMLIEHLIEIGAAADAGESGIGDLNRLYQQAKRHFDEDAAFADRARQRVVKLQAHDPETLAIWRRLVERSEQHFQDIYARLGVLLSPEDVRGESAYNDQLPGVVQAIDEAGQLVQSEGAAVIYPARDQGRFKDKDGDPLPMIVRKRDGGYLYATTDLAAARFRIRELHATRLIYVTDARQSQHFAMLFAGLRELGWADDAIRLDHVAFGAMLGEDRKPFKTRSGETVRLVDLLDESEQRARAVIEAKNPDLPEPRRDAIARTVGVGALKYGDLSNDREKDYVFNWERMLALDGNTAPYLQNAYVRIRSIFRKGSVDPSTLSPADLRIIEPAERALAMHLLQMPTVLRTVADSLEPHRLCAWLYDLATAFHRFYESCPVLASPDDATRLSRLVLCDLVARHLALGLELLGIGVVEQM